MYLTARLIGVFTYCIALFSTCLLLAQTKNAKKIKLILFVYLIALTTMGYWYLPDVHADLFRLLHISESLSSFPFDDVLYQLTQTKVPGAFLYFYLVGLFHNPHLLAGLSAFIDFALLFSILNSEVKRASIPGIYVASALFLFMSSPCIMDSISGIRNMMSCCIIIWCMYREYALGKNFLVHLPLYVLAASIHSFGQMLLIYRITFYCFEKTSILGHIFKMLISAGLLMFIFSHATTFLDGILEKGSSYYTGHQEGTSYFYIWGMVISVMKWILAVYEVVLFAKIKQNLQIINPYNPLFNLMRFLVPVVIVAPICGIFSPIFFGRLVMFAYILLVPITLLLVEAMPTVTKRYNFRLNLFLVNIIMLGISCTRGDLCSLKFFIS